MEGPSIKDSNTVSLLKKIGGAALAYLLFNLIFAMIYYYFTSDSTDPKDDDWNIPNKEAKRWKTLGYVASSVTSTVGFGDIYPKSDKMRYVSMVHQFLVAIGIISIILNFEYFKENRFLKFF